MEAADLKVAEPKRTIAQQLAAYGIEPGDTGLLDARRRLFEKMSTTLAIATVAPATEPPSEDKLLGGGLAPISDTLAKLRTSPRDG